MSAPALRFSPHDGGYDREWKEKLVGELLIPSSEKGSKGDNCRKLTVKLWRKGVVEKDPTHKGSTSTQYYRRSAGQFIYSKLDFLNCAFGIVPEHLHGFESTVDLPAFDFVEDVVPDFLLSCVQRRDFYERYGKTADGTRKAKRVSASEFLNFPILMPCREEQTKIVSFLTAVNDRIEQARKKKATLEQFKKGLSQKLFSRELRFRDESGRDYPDWEEKRLGEIATFRKGKGIAKSDITYDGATPCIRYGELYTCYSEVISDVTSSTDADPANLLLSEGGEVLLPASGEDRNDMATACCVRHPGVALGGDINVLQTEYDGEFLAYYLSRAKRPQIARVAQGNSVVHLYPNQLNALWVDIPSLPEQRKIAYALTSVDTKIGAVADQIFQLETFKKGLLQQMFV